MPAKPTAKTIIDTYTLDEIIELVKMKAHSEVEKQLDQLKKHIDSFSSGSPSVESPPQPTYTPASEESTTTRKSTRGRKPGSKKSLGDYILETLGSSPMKIEEIMDEIKAKGFKSKSKDPRRILYLELRKQVEKGNLEKTARGLYKKAS